MSLLNVKSIGWLVAAPKCVTQLCDSLRSQGRVCFSCKSGGEGDVRGSSAFRLKKTFPSLDAFCSFHRPKWTTQVWWELATPRPCDQVMACMYLWLTGHPLSHSAGCTFLALAFYLHVNVVLLYLSLTFISCVIIGAWLGCIAYSCLYCTANCYCVFYCVLTLIHSSYVQ